MRFVGPRLIGLASALAAMAIAVPARAADLTPAPSYYPAVAMPPAIYNWTGIYGGGNVGAGLVSDNFTPLLGAPPATTRLSTVGLIGGAQLGMNYQFRSWVIGPEASFTSSAITNSRLTSDGSEYLTTNPQWIGAVTGHIGYAADTLLFYAKGGGAWMHVVYTEAMSVPVGGTPTGPTSQTISDNRTGFTAGVGLEYGMTENLSAKLEYDFYDFGTRDYPAFTPASGAAPVSVNSQIHTLTVGLNYRFTFAPSGQRLCPTC